MVRVLIVCPDPELRGRLAAACQADGLQVLEADGLRRAVAGLSDERPQVALVWLAPGEGSGLETCRELRRRDRRVAIVLIGAGVDDAEVALGLELGADDHVAMPMPAAELAARVRANLLRLGRGADGQRRRLRFPDLTVDLYRRQARRGSADVGLTHTEFELLALLAGNAGRVLTREAALERIWGPELTVDVETRVIDVHVRNLRRKVEVEPSRPSRILAVPGIGYRFEDAS